MSQPSPPVARPAGQYVVCDEIASGGTATVHFGRLLGQGFARTVAIKRLHPTYARDPVFVDMFMDEARVATRIRHPNVCSVLDVVNMDDVPCLVLDYVHGEPLARLIHAAVRDGGSVPHEIAAGIVCGMLEGLHAAHEATDDRGEPLRIVHRDVSPQNVLIGADGVPRVVDFGLAKAVGRLQNTAEGHLKGKLGYMAPEQFAFKPIDRRVDIYAASVVLWETLTGEFLFERTAPSTLMRSILEGEVRPPSSVVPAIPPQLDAVCMRGLSRNPDDRFATAHEMAVALESAIAVPSAREIGAWVAKVAGDVLQARADVLARVEAEHTSPPSLPSRPSLPSLSSAPNHTESHADDPALNPADNHATASPRISRKRTAVVLLTVAVALLLVYVAVGAPRHSDDRDPSASAQSALADLPPSLAANDAAAAASPTLQSEHLVAAEPGSAAPPGSNAAPEPSANAAAKARATGFCNPPYTVDSDGIRHPKRACLVANPVPSRPTP